MGIILVIQPDEGTSWLDFLDSHTVFKGLWNLLPSDIQTLILGKSEGKIVSYNIISTGAGGGEKTRTFPGEFTGVNGVPSTMLVGNYQVLLAFLSYKQTFLQDIHEDLFYFLLEHDIGCTCRFFADEFDCTSWLIIPEVPFGTLITLLSALGAIPMFSLYKKARFR